ncbi:MAG TPA: PilZ domain-containing protein [Bryobacteraceae bacterium]|nr:PilZ domain-containing protein [Bryobacteraceae bacterium]
MAAQLNKARLSREEQTLALPQRSGRAAGDATATAASRGALFLEKRREARYPTNDPAEVEVVNGGTGRCPATVLDVSKSGLRLKLESSINRGAEVKVTLQRNVVIFGQIRYCRPLDGSFDAGILIQDMSQNSGQPSPHIEDDLLSLYVVGKGLTVPEVIKLKEHLVNCEACRIRLGEKDALLNPVRKRKILAAPVDPADD